MRVTKSMAGQSVKAQTAFAKALDGKVRRFSMPLEVKSHDPNSPLAIEGFANMALKDRMGEVIKPEAWDLENYLKNPIVLLQHDWERPVGRADVIEAKSEGLWFSAMLGNPGAGHELTDDQKKARSLVAQGILKAISVGFIGHDGEYDEETDTFYFTHCELLEFSLVSVPAQQDSMITGWKGVTDMKTKENAPTTEPKADPAPAAGDNPVMAKLDAIAADVQKCMGICQTCCDMVSKLVDKPSGDKPSTDPAPEGELSAQLDAAKRLNGDQASYIKELEEAVEKMQQALRA